MPHKPRRPCAEPGCTVLTDESYCNEHQKNYHKDHDRYRKTSHKRGYDWNWRKYRLSFLVRNPLCKYCGDRGMTVPATEVDHIVPHRGDRQLFWDASNHQGLCKSCHSIKTAKEK
ncbi:HNH endonuclease signature motif containing protein [Lentibacillus salicampi]|uniref:Putative HNH nuclease YajD n=1 Tax=Lentibacillus salicampi TaxID=175306 RepID=A0A4Y9AAD7_9BACI|nr:HNH endonuclease signature motif containing protein [Lentibacillus salicampi]TFJ92147.1 HNH endonuclease [Lentibacillus salicampi]